MPITAIKQQLLTGADIYVSNKRKTSLLEEY